MFYNVTVTGVSVAVALAIGSIQLAGVAVERLDLTSPLLTALADVDLDTAGYAMVALFALTWALAVVVWRTGRIEHRFQHPG